MLKDFQSGWRDILKTLFNPKSFFKHPTNLTNECMLKRFIVELMKHINQREKYFVSRKFDVAFPPHPLFIIFWSGNEQTLKFNWKNYGSMMTVNVNLIKLSFSLFINFILFWLFFTRKSSINLIFELQLSQQSFIS